jgi:hypothetical protein
MAKKDKHICNESNLNKTGLLVAIRATMLKVVARRPRRSTRREKKKR